MPTNRAEELIIEAVRDGARAVLVGKLSGKVGIYRRVDGRIEFLSELTSEESQSLINQFQTFAGAVVENEPDWEAHLVHDFGECPIHLLFWGFWDKGFPSFGAHIVNPAKRRHFSQLGLSAHDTAVFEGLLSHKSVVVLGCGCTGSGKFSTFVAALEELAARDHRVANLSEWLDFGYDDIHHVTADVPNLASQIEGLIGQFDAVGIAFIRSSAHLQAAWKLAANGCLVILTVNTMTLPMALRRMLDAGVSPEEIQAQFLGGWSQTLVHRQEGRGRVALFDCLGPADAKGLVVSREWLGDAERFEEHKRALWREAEPHIERGELRREDVERCLIW